MSTFVFGLSSPFTYPELLAFALYYVPFSITFGYFTLCVIWLCNVQVIQINIIIIIIIIEQCQLVFRGLGEDLASDYGLKPWFKFQVTLPHSYHPTHPAPLSTNGYA